MVALKEQNIMYDRICNLGTNHWLLAEFADGRERATVRTFELWCVFYCAKAKSYIRFRVRPIGGGVFVSEIRRGRERKNIALFSTTSIQDGCKKVLEWLRVNNYTDETRRNIYR